MANSNVEFAVIISFSVIGAFLWYYKPGPVSLARLALQGVLSLGLCTLLLHFYTRWRSSSSSPRAHYDQLQAEGDEKLKQHRDKTQVQYKQQASQYNERVLQPRLEAKQQRKEDAFRRFDGPAWKGAKQRLGGAAGGDSSPPCEEEGSRAAAQCRTLPPEPTPPPPPQPRPKTVITLPPEPAASEPGVVTLEVRTPGGRSHRRRFLPDHTIQVALDYMTTVGYHRKLYCLCSSYPRSVVSADPSLTLRQLHITTNTALMVEEIIREDEDEDED